MTYSGLVLRRLVLFGVPLVLAVLMLFLPSPYEDLAGQLVPIAGWWLTIHTLQFVLFAFMGASIWMLTDGLRGISVVVSRVAAVVFAIFYDIGDAVASISTGILARHAADLPAEEQAAIVRGMEVVFQSSTKNLAFGTFFVAVLWLELGRSKRVSGEDFSGPEPSPAPEASSR